MEMNPGRPLEDILPQTDECNRIVRLDTSDETGEAIFVETANGQVAQQVA